MPDQKIVKGSRQAGIEGDYSYRSLYNAGGARHVEKNKKKKKEKETR